MDEAATDKLVTKLEERMDRRAPCAQCGKMTSARLDGKPALCFACLTRKQEELIARLEAL